MKKMGIGVGVVVLNEQGDILLGLRNDDKIKADSLFSGEGTWTLPGGKLDFGETFEVAAKRELLEETNIVATQVEVFCFNNDINENAHFVTVGVVVKKYEGHVIAMEPDEIVKWAWFNINNLPANLFLPSKKCLFHFKNKTFYKEGF